MEQLLQDSAEKGSNRRLQALGGVSQIQHFHLDFVLCLLAMVGEGGDWWRLREAPI
jgi:hypothetical protein